MDPDHRSVWYIAAPSGAGKSTFAAMLLKTFKKLHPKKPIYFFSRTAWKDDPAYTKIKPEQVKIDIGLVDKPILIESDIEKGAALVFDDIATLHDKPIRDEVYHIIKDALEVGRKLDLSVILTSHLINNNDKAFGRIVLNETQNLVIFPRGSSSYQITYVLKNYYGLDRHQVDAILKLNSRWVVISRTFPLVVMYEHGCYTL